MSWEESVNVANVLGVRSICIFNDFRERLIGSRLTQAVDRGPRGDQRSVIGENLMDTDPRGGP